MYPGSGYAMGPTGPMMYQSHMIIPSMMPGMAWAGNGYANPPAMMSAFPVHPSTSMQSTPTPWEGSTAIQPQSCLVGVHPKPENAPFESIIIGQLPLRFKNNSRDRVWGFLVSMCKANPEDIFALRGDRAATKGLWVADVRPSAVDAMIKFDKRYQWTMDGLFTFDREDSKSLASLSRILSDPNPRGIVPQPCTIARAVSQSSRWCIVPHRFGPDEIPETVEVELGIDRVLVADDDRAAYQYLVSEIKRVPLDKVKPRPDCINVFSVEEKGVVRQVVIQCFDFQRRDPNGLLEPSPAIASLDSK